MSGTKGRGGWEAPDLCEKKMPLRRKRCGFCPMALSIRFTSSLSILLLPNRTGKKNGNEEMTILGGVGFGDQVLLKGKSW